MDKIFMQSEYPARYKYNKGIVLNMRLRYVTRNGSELFTTWEAE